MYSPEPCLSINVIQGKGGSIIKADLLLSIKYFDKSLVCVQRLFLINNHKGIYLIFVSARVLSKRKQVWFI